MIQAIFQGEDYLRINGLTQWDYGQELQIYGLGEIEEAEIHFALENSSKAIIAECQRTEEMLTVRIPDSLLEEGETIKAYIYLITPGSGKTIKTVAMPVTRRQRPEGRGDAEEENLIRKLMKEVEGKADNIKLVEGALQLTSGGKEIGDKVRVSAGGREVELRNNGTAIQWRYTDSNEWKDLVSIESLKGPAGETPEFEIREGHLIAIYK